MVGHKRYICKHRLAFRALPLERTPTCHSPTAYKDELCLQTSRLHSVGCGECRREVCTHIFKPLANGRDRSQAPTAGLRHRRADGTCRSTVGTLNMGTWAGTGEALAWDIASDVPSTSPSHGSNSGAHGEAYSMHTYAFKH